MAVGDEEFIITGDNMKKINKHWGDRIQVNWIDACEKPGWLSLEEALTVPEEILCFTNGFFLGQNKEYVSIASTIGKTKDSDIGGTILIPKGCIKNYS